MISFFKKKNEGMGSVFEDSAHDIPLRERLPYKTNDLA
jgi:hypothetical protein